MKKKIGLLFTSVALSIGLFAGVASAHVTVSPKETSQGSYEKFTVRVPTEKESATVKVELKIPVESVDISRVEPKPGWKYEMAKGADNKTTAIVWSAAGEGLGPTEFGEFNIQGKVADNASQITWKAVQTYKDGSIVEWTGAQDAKTPASVTTVKPKQAGAADGHGAPAPAAGAADGHGSAAPAAGTSAPAAAAGPAGSSSLPLYLSVAALAIAILSLIMNMMKKKA